MAETKGHILNDTQELNDEDIDLDALREEFGEDQMNPDAFVKLLERETSRLEEKEDEMLILNKQCANQEDFLEARLAELRRKKSEREEELKNLTAAKREQIKLLTNQVGDLEKLVRQKRRRSVEVK